MSASKKIPQRLKRNVHKSVELDVSRQSSAVPGKKIAQALFDDLRFRVQGIRIPRSGNAGNSIPDFTISTKHGPSERGELRPHKKQKSESSVVSGKTIAQKFFEDLKLRVQRVPRSSNTGNSIPDFTITTKHGHPEPEGSLPHRSQKSEEQKKAEKKRRSEVYLEKKNNGTVHSVGRPQIAEPKIDSIRKRNDRQSLKASSAYNDLLRQNPAAEAIINNGLQTRQIQSQLSAVLAELPIIQNATSILTHAIKKKEIKQPSHKKSITAPSTIVGGAHKGELVTMLSRNMQSKEFSEAVGGVVTPGYVLRQRMKLNQNLFPELLSKKYPSVARVNVSPEEIALTTDFFERNSVIFSG